MEAEVIGGSDCGRTYTVPDTINVWVFTVRTTGSGGETAFAYAEVPVRKYRRPNGDRIRAIDGNEVDRERRRIRGR